MKKRRNQIFSILTILAGSFLLALGVQVFIVPAKLVTGGATGIAIALSRITGLNVSTFALALNIGFLIAGLILLGKRFALTTLLSSISYPLFLRLLERLLDGYVLTNDLILNAVFGGIVYGFAIGIVFRVGSSTGGTDVVTLSLNKYFRIPVSVSMYVLDAVIALTQLVLMPVENVLYGVINIFICSIIADRVMLAGSTRTEVKIISLEYEKINQAILKYLDRGVTLLEGRGGYTHGQGEMVYSVISNRQLPRLEKLIHSIDPSALVVITRAQVISGRGFTLAKSSEEEASK